jgi:hypothetical protein
MSGPTTQGRTSDKAQRMRGTGDEEFNYRGRERFRG